MTAGSVTKRAAESPGDTGPLAWPRVETWLLALVIALVAAAVTLGPVLAHAGQ